MSVITDVTSVLSTFGTLIIGGLVYRFGKQQARSTNAIAERQHRLERQTFRLQLLSERTAVVDDVREVYGNYAIHARPQPELTKKLLMATTKARLLYHDDLLRDLEEVTKYLILLQSNLSRQEVAVGRAASNQERLRERQYELEDVLWPTLEPLVKKLEAATRILEPPD